MNIRTQFDKFSNNLMGKLKKLADSVFVDKYNCMICDRELFEANRYAMCIRCSAEMSKINYACVKCGKPLNAHTEYCLNCQNRERHFTKAYSVFEYQGKIEELVYGLKFGGKKYLAKYLASFLADKVIEEQIVADVVIAIPLHTIRQKQRGYNQSHLLAEAMCSKLKLPMSEGLKRIKATEMQTKCSGKDRIKNVENAFIAEEKYKGKRLLLIDDVLTTGATMSEAAKALKAAGALEVIGLTLCNVRDKFVTQSYCIDS